MVKDERGKFFEGVRRPAGSREYSPLATPSFALMGTAAVIDVVIRPDVRLKTTPTFA